MESTVAMPHHLDYYAILQVHPSAEKEVIDAAYRRLAAKYHPDVSQDPKASERMKRINAAYQVLSDPVKRAAYDATRQGRFQPTASPTPATGQPQYANREWRHWLVTAAATALILVAFRLGPRVVLPLAMLGALIWLLYRLGRPRR